ncbi:ferredoxin:CoB-CoM heterodisulfide reductase subunit HdrB [uncultured Methanobrevibacter sp.]|uniref:ferredoxin:CoB-CoM heterodisulfide reductase subunit HdrB n=1 Tax=uncultured Methanobrevibacter sp. TaxID=253161 RepID=UPI00258D4FAF|nr:ferredoxin:CoB-CoM heterodisulfide reductase subunit HdrB [uncultured Methanobrevibacter sp.]
MMVEIPDKDILLFKSCLVSVEYPGIESSTKYVFDKIGVDYHIDKGQTCCTGLGHYSDVFDQLSTTVNGARHFALAKKLNRPNFVTMCATCYAINKKCGELLNTDENLRNKVNNIFDKSGYGWMKYTQGDIVPEENIFHIVDIFYSKRREIAENLVYDLSDIVMATHHGCHYYKAHYKEDITSIRNPHILDDVIQSLGVNTIGWYDFKRATCGSGISQRFVHKESCLDATEDKLKSLKDNNTDLLVHLCPNCQVQFDRYQPYIDETRDKNYGFAHLNIAQLVALALGGDPYKVLGIQTHTCPVEPIINKLKPISNKRKEEIIKQLDERIEFESSPEYNVDMDPEPFVFTG